jgi:hypothetical protein
MCEPRRLTTLWASTACYRDSFTLLIISSLRAIVTKIVSSNQVLNQNCVRISCLLHACYMSHQIHPAWWVYRAVMLWRNTAHVLDLTCGLGVKRITARRSGAVVVAALCEGRWVPHYNQDPVMTHTQVIILTSVRGLAQIHSALRRVRSDYSFIYGLFKSWNSSVSNT